MGRFAHKNKGVKFLLNAIDGFSKKLWSVPLKNKGAPEVLRGFKEVLSQMGKNPHHLCSDKEKAIRSHIFKAFCKAEGIQIRHPTTSPHCSLVER